MAEKRRISIDGGGDESQKCDSIKNDTVTEKVTVKPHVTVSPVNGAIAVSPAPGEVRNPEGRNQYNTLTRKGMEELLAGNKIDLTINYEDKNGVKKSRRLHFEMKDGESLHKGVSAILLGKALSGDLKAASELVKIVNDKDKFGVGDGERLPQEIHITVVNAVRN